MKEPRRRVIQGYRRRGQALRRKGSLRNADPNILTRFERQPWHLSQPRPVAMNERDDMITIAYRLGQVESAQKEQAKLVDQHGEQLAVHREQISGEAGLVKAMKKLGDTLEAVDTRLSKKLDGVNRALWALAVAFIVAAVTIALAVH